MRKHSSLQKINIEEIIVSGNFHNVILGKKMDSGKSCQFIPKYAMKG